MVVDDVVFLGDKYHQSDVENGVLSVNTPKYKGFQGGVQHLSSRLNLVINKSGIANLFSLYLSLVPLQHNNKILQEEVLLFYHKCLPNHSDN